MQAIHSWPFARVLLLSAAWVVLCVLVAAAWIAFELGVFSAASSGGAGIGAVSIGINALVLAIPVGPPIALIAVWLVARLR